MDVDFRGGRSASQHVERRPRCHMGNFYTNVTLRSRDTDKVVGALTDMKRTAFVTTPLGEFSVAYDQATESHDPQVIDELVSGLTKRLKCAALVVVNHDDDMLWFGLYERGTLLDEYSSAPGYFSDEDRPPEGGDAKRLCRALGSAGRPADVDAVLRAPAGSQEGFVVEVERHRKLVETLGLPACAVGAGFDDIESGDLPDEIGPDQIRRVP